MLDFTDGRDIQTLGLVSTPLDFFILSLIIKDVVRPRPGHFRGHY